MPTASSALRLVLAQYNFTVVDPAANARRIIAACQEAVSRWKADLVVFPECALSGYPLDDLAGRADVNVSVKRHLHKIASAVSETIVFLGHPEREDGKTYNTLSILRGGKRLARYRKQQLQNYGPYDDNRQFTAGQEATFITLNSIRIAPAICEDVWHENPLRLMRDAGAMLCVSIHASPFHTEKSTERLRRLRQQVRQNRMPLVYVNLVGGQDEVVFDGGSLALNADGSHALQAPFFTEGLYPLDIRPENGTIRLQAIEPQAQPVTEPMETLYQALVWATRDFIRKSRLTGGLVGVSGGIDSALVLCIAADALGAENVRAVLMPSRHTSPASVSDAQALADTLGVRTLTLPIERIHRSFLETLQPCSPAAGMDIAYENLQARSRGTLLMAMANREKALVLCTGNKSESAVGYSTLYGDTVGGFAPIKDLYKTQVIGLARWLNGKKPLIPENILTRPPTAELRPEQKDEDSLPPYPVLDDILQRYIEQDQSVADIIAAGHPPRLVRRVAHRVAAGEYKRWQYPPGPCVSRRGFRRERRYPVCFGDLPGLDAGPSADTP